MLICASRTKISISAVAFDPSTAVTLTLYQSPRDKQEKGEGRNTTQMILRSPFSCDLLRRDRSVTVKDVDLCKPHQNLDWCGRVRSINGGHTHAAINRPEINRRREKGGTNTNDPPFSILLMSSRSDTTR